LGWGWLGTVLLPTQRQTSTMTPSFRTLIAAAAVALAFAGVISASASPPAAAATPAGACADDANATQVLSSAEGQKAFGGPVSCAVLAAMHVCNHPTHGARVREHCTATCGACPDSTCDPDDATVDAATDVNTTAAVRGDDDDDDSSSSLTWGQYLHKQLAAANAAKDVLQRAVGLSLAANKVLADKVSAAEGKADSAAEQVAAMQKELDAEKAANKVLVANMQKELDAVKDANKVLADAVSAAERKPSTSVGGTWEGLDAELGGAVQMELYYLALCGKPTC